MGGSFLIYGATGYTGRLTARLAVDRGLRPILGGRDGHRVSTLASELGLQWRTTPLSDPQSVDGVLDGVDAVLNMAGPFSKTAEPMVEACLRTRTHYLDITGEIDVFEAVFRRDADAQAAGVVLLPGVGFDVVPSDCLALHVARACPGADHLAIGIQGLGTASRGTSRTALESLGQLTRIRRDGTIHTAPPGRLTRQFDFGQGNTDCTAVGWGDVSTAYRSTGIPSITVYFARSGAVSAMLAAARTLGPLARLWPVEALLSHAIALRPAGPSDAERQRGQANLIAEAVAGDGRKAAARLTTPEAYSLTADAALVIVDKVLSDPIALGAWTPAAALGPDFVFELQGVSRQDLP